MELKIQPSLQPLHELAESSFSYGRAQAKIQPLEQANRNSRVIARKLGEIVEGLQLSIDIPETRRIISHDNGNAFAEVILNGKKHFIMARTPLDGRNFSESLQEQKPEVTIVSGPCLFSADAVQAISHEGENFALTRRGEIINQTISHINVDNNLSLYEAEAISRLSTLIHDLVQNNQHIKHVALNIPEAEYYLFGLEAFEQGHLSSHQLREWFNNVDYRHDRQIKLIKNRIQRGTNVEIYESSPLLPVKNYIRIKVLNNELPTFSEAVELLSENNELWRDLFAVSKINNWQDIIDLSYVYAELEAGEQHGGKPTFALVIENPTENKIFANAKKVAIELQKIRSRIFNVVAIYPHELILPVGDNANRTMYHITETTDDKFSLFRQIVNIYRRGGSV